MNTRPNSPYLKAFANPLIVGAATVLTAVVAVFLSYNANAGLPFVPTYNFKAEVPDAAGLTRGNEARIGGKRVGVIAVIEAKQSEEGETTAVLHLKIEQQLKPLPSDTKVVVRPRSTLGLKYLELAPGRSEKGIAQGTTLPLKQARDVVDLDQVVDTFDAATRRAAQGTLGEFGNAVAGRGQDVNNLLLEAPPLLKGGERLARTLASEDTRLARLFPALHSTTSELAGVTSQLGRTVGTASTTAGALASQRGPLAEGIEELPATEIEATRTLRVARPVLRDASALFRDLRPAAPLLRPAAIRLDRAIDKGLPVLRRVVPLSERLKTTLGAVEDLSSDPTTLSVLGNLDKALTSAGPTVDFLAPAQTVCNYLGAWTHNVPSTISEGDAAGTWFRTLVVVPSDGENNPQAKPTPNLHVTPSPATGQQGECEAGNEPYGPGPYIGSPQGKQRGATIDTKPPAGTPGGP